MRELQFSMLFHVLSPDDFEAFSTSALYGPGPEGFIHLCRAEQLEGVVERYYADTERLYLLVFAEEELSSRLKWEGGFPHYYGAIETSWPKDQLLWERDSSTGSFRYPEAWEHYRV